MVLNHGVWSLSLRRAWIEITTARMSWSAMRRRSPYGERGLKSVVRVDYHRCLGSLSLRRAWIEIDAARPPMNAASVALLTESVD